MMKSNIFYKKSLVWIFIIASIFASIAHAQFESIGHVRYDVEDGLSSSEVYYTHQDHKGYMWFCTDQGVSKFDGQKFINYSTQDGLLYNTIFKAFQKDHHIWFTGMDGSITIYDYEKDSFYPHWANEKISKLLNSDWVQIIGFTQDKAYISFGQGNSNKNFIVIDETKKTVELEPIVLNPDKKTKIYKFDNVYTCVDYKDEKYNTTYQIKVFEGTLDTSYLSKSIDGLVSISQYENETLFCCKNGFYILAKNKLTKYKQLYSDTSKDREGNYWVSSTAKGVFKIPSFNFNSIPFNYELYDNEQIISLNQTENYIIFGTTSSSIFSLDKRNEISKIYEFPFPNHSIKHIAPFRKKLFTSSGILIEENKDKSINVINDQKGSGYISVLELNNGDLLGFQYTARGIIKEIGDKISTKILPKDLSRTSTAYQSKSDDVYVCTNQGVFKISDYNYENPIRLNESFNIKNVSVKKVTEVGLGNIIFATKGEGLIIFQNNKVQQIGKEDGLSADFVNDIIVQENANLIWCASNNGIDRIKYSLAPDGSIRINDIQNLSKNSGLVSNYIKRLAHFNNRIYGISNDGIIYFDDDVEIPLNKPPFTHIMETKQHNIPFKNGAQFKWNENSIRIKYLGITMNNISNGSRYRYKLVGENSQASWIETNETTASFSDLRPGKYDFHVSSRAANSDWSASETIQFNIAPHLLNRTWMRILILLGITCMIWFYFRMQVSRLKVKQQEELKLNKLNRSVNSLKLEVLRGQMNPHFVFNVLNSIQKIVLRNDKWKASKLISQFSKLMRSSLEYSRLEFIPLQEEISYLKNYLEIESSRFPDRFKYSIICSDELDSLIRIPPLLVQPLCENAIKHAYDGKLVTITITFDQTGPEAIRIDVTDDGIGYLATQNNEDNNIKKSLSLKILTGRLNLLREQGYIATFDKKPYIANTNVGSVFTIVVPAI